MTSAAIEPYIPLSIDEKQRKLFEVKHLDESFYRGIRDEVTPQRLSEMSLLAKNLQEPLFFGTYIDDSHYAMTLKLMLHSTEETRHRGAFLIRKILPMLQQKNNLLDIGSGDGQVMSWVGNHFKHVTAINTNKEEIEQLNCSKKLLKRNIHLNKIHGSILDKSLPRDFYDLTLLCHVLYYLPRNQWLKTVDLAYNATTNNGIIVIALSGDNLGKAELIKHYNGVFIDIGTIAKQCIDKFGGENVHIFSSEELITTKDLNAMLHIAGFFLCDATASAEKKALMGYINANCKKNDNLFHMTTEQKFIVIQKASRIKKCQRSYSKGNICEHIAFDESIF